MTLAPLALFALLGLPGGPDPEALVGDLSSAEEAVRVEAAGALEELGRPALPALYAVRGKGEPAVQKQVAQLIDLIERQRLLRATRVRLDPGETTLGEAARSLRNQTGFALIVPDDLRDRPVTWKQDEPLPFWSALDRLAELSGTRHLPDVVPRPVPREPAVRFVAADGPPPTASDAGPFRVYLVHLGRHRSIAPRREGAEAQPAETLTADLQVVAEPGLAIRPARPIVLQAAFDDQDRDLRLDPPVAPSSFGIVPYGFSEGHAGLLGLTVSLRPTGGRRLKRLRGYVPITVVARAGDPLIIPLHHLAAGGTAARDGVALQATAPTREGGDAPFTLTLLIRGELTGPRPGGVEPFRLGRYEPPFAIEDHVEIHDARGKPVWWYTTSWLDGPEGGREARLSAFTGANGPPSRLLYHGIVGAASELVFEFADVPLPGDAAEAQGEGPGG